MAHAALFTTEKRKESLILVVDKKGIIGQKLVDRIKNESVVVFVSQEKPSLSENIVYIPFSKSFPTIPNNRYSHIIIIDEELEFHDKTIESFLKEAKKDNAKIFFGINTLYISEKFYLKFVSRRENVRLGIIGDVFAKETIINKESEINKIFSSIKNEGEIIIPGDGTKEMFPVFLDDVANAILEICFLDFNEKVFNIFPKNIISFLTVAAIFKKTHPEIKLDFIKEKKEKQKDKISFQGKYVFGEKYDLEEKIKNINIKKIESAERKITKNSKNTKNSILLTSIFFLTLLFLPLLTTLLLGTAGNLFINQAEKQLRSGNVTSARLFAENSLRSYFLLESSVFILKEEFGAIGQKDRISSLGTSVVSKYALGKVYFGFSYFLEKLNTALLGKSNNSTKDFEESVVALASANYNFNRFLDKNENNDIFKKLNRIFNFTSSTINIWPSLFGINNKRNYLVLIEDNSSIRPGGGIINYYALLGVENGRINKFKIFGTSASDSKLKTHVEPPYPIRRFLPEIDWTLRDSNFNIDFSKGANFSSAFLNAEEQTVVDGVIAVDATFVKDILSLSGPIKASGVRQEITYDNFYALLLNSDTDFIKNVIDGFIAKYSQKKDPITLDLLDLMSKEAANKHLLFSFNNASEQARTAISGYSSILENNEQNEKHDVSDFMGINEASLGVSGTSLFISRRISQEVNVQKDGSVAEALTVVFRNTAEALSKRTYKSYIRFILPLGSGIDSITINGLKQTITKAITDPTVYEQKDFVPPPGLEVNKETQAGKDIYGFLMNVDPQEIKTISLKYTLLKRIDLSAPEQNYFLKIFKQPGIDSYPYNFSINYPQGVTVINIPPEFKNIPNGISVSTQLLKDMNIGIKISPQ